MPVLNDDLSDLARVIAHGTRPSSRIDKSYSQYPLAVAIEIYRNNYRGNLHDALAGAYPVIRHLIGKDFFHLMTRSFIERHTSHSGNLHHYGQQMPAFLSSFAPALQLVYLPDVAALEWACHCAYYADDVPTLDIGRLAQIPPEHYPGLVLHTHPACHVVSSDYPIAAIWHAHQPDAPDDFNIDLADGACQALVFRKEDKVQVSKLAPAEAGWLSSVQAGVSLGAATDTTLAKFPDFDLQASLRNWVSLGVITDFSLREKS